MVAVPAAVDGDVLHRQRPRAALLHRAVLAEGLRELHARRRNTGRPCARSGTAPPTSLSATPCNRTRRPSPAPTAACAGVCRLMHRRETYQRAAIAQRRSSPASTRRTADRPRAWRRCWRTASARSSSSTADRPIATVERAQRRRRARRDRAAARLRPRHAGRARRAAAGTHRSSSSSTATAATGRR